MALARHSLMESYSTGRLESRLAAMVTAAEYYKKAAKAEFMAIGQQRIVMLSKSTWSSPLYMVRRMMACSG